MKLVDSQSGRHGRDRPLAASRSRCGLSSCPLARLALLALLATAARCTLARPPSGIARRAAANKARPRIAPARTCRRRRTRRGTRTRCVSRHRARCRRCGTLRTRRRRNRGRRAGRCRADRRRTRSSRADCRQTRRAVPNGGQSPAGRGNRQRAGSTHPTATGRRRGPHHWRRRQRRRRHANRGGPGGRTPARSSGLRGANESASSSTARLWARRARQGGGWKGVEQSAQRVRPIAGNDRPRESSARATQLRSVDTRHHARGVRGSPSRGRRGRRQKARSRRCLLGVRVEQGGVVRRPEVAGVSGHREGKRAHQLRRRRGNTLHSERGEGHTMRVRKAIDRGQQVRARRFKAGPLPNAPTDRRSLVAHRRRRRRARGSTAKARERAVVAVGHHHVDLASGTNKRTATSSSSGEKRADEERAEEWAHEGGQMRAQSMWGWGA